MAIAIPIFCVVVFILFPLVDLNLLQQDVFCFVLLCFASHLLL